jgi:replicative DNA helicase
MPPDGGLIVVPHNRKAEETILGCILIDNSLMRQCSLSVDDFRFDRHQMYYAMFLDLHENQEPIDLVIMSQTLSAEDLNILNGFMSDAVTTSNFSYYEETVKELAIRRRLQKLGWDLARWVADATVDELVTRVRLQVSEIIAGRGSVLVPMSQVAKEVKEFVDRRRHHAGGLSGLAMGLKDLDEFTDGLQNGDMIVLAGRPGSGKSAFAAHVAQEVAGQGGPVGFISLEMGTHQLGIRSLSSLSQVEMWKLRKGVWGDSAYGMVLEGLAKMGRLPIWFSFSASDAKSIEKTITNLVEEKECKLIILDYLQLVRAADANSREREVAQVSNIMKNAARMNNIPIIAISQLNRGPEKEKRRPILADLRESGAIEQDADVVIFLHRGEAEGTTEMIFAKGRNIGTDTFTVVWDDKTMTFRDYERRNSDE